MLDRLERKHGGTIAAVLAHAEACRQRRAELVGAEVAIEAATATLGEARAQLAAGSAGAAQGARGGRLRSSPPPCGGASTSWR